MFPAVKETAPPPQTAPLQTPTIPRRNIPPLLRPAAIQIAEYVRQHYFIEVSNDVTVAMLMTPSYWGNYLAQLRRHDIVEVVRQDGAIDLQLRVASNADGMVKMILRQNRDSTREAAPTPAGDTRQTLETPEGYRIKPTPGQGTYYVQLAATGATSRTGLPTKDAAIEFAIKHRAEAEKVADTTGIVS